MKTVVIYTQPVGWHFCQQTKEFLSQKGVSFQERDIINDQTAMSELMEIGVMTTPVTVIDGEVVVGFDRQKLEELLEDSAR